MISLGPFQIEHPFILAPMAGITHSPFRRLMRQNGSAFVVSELISANGMDYEGPKTLDLLRFHEDERRVGLQIFGEDEEILCNASKKIESLGADFVDLNLGCPVTKVVKKGAGAALCKEPKVLGKILKAMVQSVKIPVTIKIRTGWDSETRNAGEVIQAAADAGVAWVAVHGRTRAQGYSGDADWEFIGNLKAKSPIPIIGNGDLQSPELALERYRTYGVDAVLIGRGALRNPFIFKQAYQLFKGDTYHLPTFQDYLELIERQKALLYENYPDRLAILHVRKFLAWYSSGFPGCHEFRSRVFSVSEPEELWEDAKRFFEKSTRDRDLKIYAEPFLMGGHG